MRRGMYLRLAVTNLVKNRKIYVPYLLTCICSIAMFYMMLFLKTNPGIEQVRGGGNVKGALSMGIVVIAVFSAIFLVYSNGFLMKFRRKELGLYSILGMERRHIAGMMIQELLLTALVSAVLGILMGVLGGKLLFLLLLRLIHQPVPLGYFVSVEAVKITLILFAAIYGITLLNDIRQIRLASPIELLHSAGAGEKEPKAKWLMALIGFCLLGVGYYLAWTTKSPLKAVNVFLAAVLMVMAATYLLFCAGSIVVLKILRWNKKFYYQTRHFASVSGLIYRMKQNAVGLANICILSTGVLLMVSTTVCLYFGTEDSLRTQYPNGINITVRNLNLGQEDAVEDTVRQTLEELGTTGRVQRQMVMTEIAVLREGQLRFLTSMAGEDTNDTVMVYLFSQEEYEQITGRKGEPLEDGQLLAMNSGDALADTLRIEDETYQIQKAEPFELRSNLGVIVPSLVLAANEDTCRKLDEVRTQAVGDSYFGWTCDLGVDLEEKDLQQEGEAGAKIRENLEGLLLGDGFSGEANAVNVQLRQTEVQSTWEFNGGLLFLGMFLGMVFLLGTALIIYYKQISEGYEDRNRYEIMQKVGMTRKEVQQSVQSQIRMVFFLPLLMAVCHMTVAFQLVRRLMEIMYMVNTKLFILCTAGTVLVFALVYGLIYWVTAGIYYKIVR